METQIGRQKGWWFSRMLLVLPLDFLENGINLDGVTFLGIITLRK